MAVEIHAERGGQQQVVADVKPVDLMIRVELDIRRHPFAMRSRERHEPREPPISSAVPGDPQITLRSRTARLSLRVDTLISIS